MYLAMHGFFQQEIEKYNPISFNFFTLKNKYITNI